MTSRRLIDLPRQMQRLPDTLDVREVAELLEAVDGTDLVGLRDRALLELLYAAGLRISEALGPRPRGPLAGRRLRARHRQGRQGTTGARR